LSQFLNQLLQMDRDSYEWLWIDAICIDLANDCERTHQVRLIADIYGKAYRVIVWLGTAYDQSDDAMSGLLSSKGGEQALELIPWISAVVDLCSRPYWCRLWVLQELKLAREKEVMCGSKVISWQHFERFMLRVDGKFKVLGPSLFPSRSTEEICNSRAMRMIKLTCTPVGTSLLDLMDMSVHLRCEEPRDRVHALCGLATAEAASIDKGFEDDIPVFLNMLFRHHLEQSPEISILDVASTCGRLERIFGALPGTIFELHTPTNHLAGKAGLMYQRLCTRPIHEPGLTLLWAIQHEHLHVQELIKVAHRLQTPTYYMFWALQVVGSIIGFTVALSMVPRPLSSSNLLDLITGLTAFLLTMISINCAVLLLKSSPHIAYGIPKLTISASRNSEWEQQSAWPFYTDYLEHGLTWRTLSWVPFIIHEGLMYIAAPACQSLKRRFLGVCSRWRGAKSVVLE
jgi:hypothetical protein